MTITDLQQEQKKKKTGKSQTGKIILFLQIFTSVTCTEISSFFSFLCIGTVFTWLYSPVLPIDLCSSHFPVIMCLYKNKSLFLSLVLSHCEGHLDTAAAVAEGKTCPEIIFEGTLRMGAIAAEVRVRERDCALSRADCTVTGGRRKA